MVQPKSKTREYIESLLIAVIIALFVRSVFIQAYKIPSGSMEPTLLIGDHLTGKPVKLCRQSTLLR